MKIYVTSNLMMKMKYIVENYDYEIGGYLIGEVRNREIFLQDLLIPRQDVSAVHVNITPEAQLELRQKYGKKVFKILGHFHSHHSMGAFWSGTDLNNMKGIMSSRKLYVFIVGSRTGFLTRLSIRDPVEFDLDGCDLEINTMEFNLFKKQILDRVRQNITRYASEDEVTENKDVSEEEDEYD